MELEKNKKIAIIGAGASGLTAGWELKKKGYKNVVIFEKEPRVGGKTFSYTYKDKNFELGSMMFSRLDQTAALARRFNFPFSAFETKKFYLSEKKYMNPLAYAMESYSLPRILGALYRIKRIIARNHLEEPGYKDLNPELFQDFARYSKEKNLEAGAKVFEPAISGLGYGYYDTTPALYVLKIMSSLLNYSLVASLLLNGHMTCYFSMGWQSLWEKVAAELEVRTSAALTSIVRSDNHVLITEQGTTHVFDKLIVTSPLKRLQTFLDVDESEKSLFQKIRHYQMVSTLVQCTTPLPRSFFFADNAHADRIGHVLGIENYYPETSAGVLFQVVPEDMGDDVIQSTLKEDLLRQVGCSVESSICQKKWEYFYHVDTATLEDGFYQKLFDLQGKKNTFYLGSIFNYETVAHCEEYAAEIIKKYF